jgi:3-phenylpropionate/trans-cinnamate dioxygenase ferredoxin subunit
MTDPDLPFLPLGPVGDLPPGGKAEFQVDGHSVLVVNCGGEYFAIEDRCTHDDGPLADGRIYGCEVECPRHGAKFDLKTGKATALPAFNAVASYPTRVNADGVLEVQIVESPTPRFEDPRGTFSF